MRKSNGRKPDGTFGRLLRNVRSVFIGGAAIDRAAAAERAVAGGATPTAAAAADSAPAPSASELINEGLRERQRVGTAAARPFF
jgi:hypothetical protein